MVNLKIKTGCSIFLIIIVMIRFFRLNSSMLMLSVLLIRIVLKISSTLIRSCLSDPADSSPMKSLEENRPKKLFSGEKWMNFLSPEKSISLKLFSKFSRNIYNTQIFQCWPYLYPKDSILQNFLPTLLKK